MSTRFPRAVLSRRCGRPVPGNRARRTGAISISHRRPGCRGANEMRMAARPAGCYERRKPGPGRPIRPGRVIRLEFRETPVIITLTSKLTALDCVWRTTFPAPCSARCAGASFPRGRDGSRKTVTDPCKPSGRFGETLTGLLNV